MAVVYIETAYALHTGVINHLTVQIVLNALRFNSVLFLVRENRPKVWNYLVDFPVTFATNEPMPSNNPGSITLHHPPILTS